MTPTRKRRLFAVLSILVGVGAAAALSLTAFQDNLLYYFSPTEVHAGEVPQGRTIRVGGLVVAGTVKRDPDSLAVRFDVTDSRNMLTVEYHGILPDLFREGQGIIAQGQLQDNGVVLASEVLAKHDENYMPPEVADSLKKYHGETGNDS